MVLRLCSSFGHGGWFLEMIKPTKMSRVQIPSYTGNGKGFVIYVCNILKNHNLKLTNSELFWQTKRPEIQ